MAEKRNYRCVPSLQQFYSGGALAVASDGSFIACACDEKIKLVNSSDASVRAVLEGDSESVTALALSPDDRLLFSASHSRLIRVWELASGKCLRLWKGHDGPVMAMACHLSGGLLATAGADKKVCVWDVDGGYCTHYFRGHQGVVTSIIFHPDANRLLLFSGSDDATVRVWNLEAKKCIAVLDKHFSAVTSLAVSENGQTLLSAGRDKVVNVWDLRSYSFQTTIPAYEILETVCIIHSNTEIFASIPKKVDKKSESPTIYFLTAGERGVMRIWSTAGATCLYEQKTSDTTITSDEDDTRRGITAAAILPSNHGLLCVTADQQFLFYSPTHTSDGAFTLNLYRRLVGYNEEIVDLKFLGEEEQSLAVATNLEQVRVYEFPSMSCSYVLTGHKDIVLCLDTCVTSTGRTLILTGSKDKTVRIWEAESHECIGLGAGHTGAVGAVAFSKKNKNFFVSGSSDRTIKFWSLDGIFENVSPESELKPRALVAAHDKDINTLAVSPNDGLACSGSQDRTASIWRLPDLVFLVSLKGHKRGIWSVEFSPVDQCVLTSSGDKTLKMWAVSDGSCLKTFEGHTSSVLRASFLSRGAQIVSCGADGLVKLWTVKTSECIATYDQHDDKVWALAVGKKTEVIATGGGDALVNLWHDCTSSDKEEALRKQEEEILRGQELENAVSDADYLRAIRLAFELRRPHKLFELFSLLCRKKMEDDSLKRALRSLGKDEIRLLLEYIREWNTKPKLCHVAQAVLSQIFKLLPPNEIIEIKGIAELLEGLIPYSQRHFVRVDRLVRSTYLLDYTLAKMTVLDPDASSLLSIKEVEDGSMQHDVILSDNTTKEQNESSAVVKEKKKSSKKRKLGESRGVKKKTKEAKVSGMAIALEA